MADTSWVLKAVEDEALRQAMEKIKSDPQLVRVRGFNLDQITQIVTLATHRWGVHWTMTPAEIRDRMESKIHAPIPEGGPDGDPTPEGKVHVRKPD